MICISCFLINKEIKENEIGVHVTETITREIPIIKVEKVYSDEFYQANQQGYKPSLRLRISRLNYNEEQELKYNGLLYSVIRTDEVTLDEIVLVCERKISNVR